MLAWVFNDQFGLANLTLNFLGFQSLNWLAEARLAFSVVVFTDIWLQTPFYTILLLAGLRSLPPEPFEAARIDGASSWQVLRHVTLPLLKPVFVVALTIRLIDAFRVFDTVWVLTKGGPARATEVFSIYAYMESFVYLNYGKGQAAALIGGILIGVLGWVLYRSLRASEEIWGVAEK